MKKLLTVITALVVLGIAGTTQQAFGDGDHGVDSVLIDMVMTPLDESALPAIVPIPYPGGPGDSDGQVLQFMSYRALAPPPAHTSGTFVPLSGSTHILEMAFTADGKLNSDLCGEMAYFFSTTSGIASPSSGLYTIACSNSNFAGCGGSPRPTTDPPCATEHLSSTFRVELDNPDPPPVTEVQRVLRR